MDLELDEIFPKLVHCSRAPTGGQLGFLGADFGERLFGAVDPERKCQTHEPEAPDKVRLIGERQRSDDTRINREDKVQAKRAFVLLTEVCMVSLCSCEYVERLLLSCPCPADRLSICTLHSTISHPKRSNCWCPERAEAHLISMDLCLEATPGIASPLGRPTYRPLQPYQSYYYVRSTEYDVCTADDIQARPYTFARLSGKEDMLVLKISGYTHSITNPMPWLPVRKQLHTVRILRIV